MYIYTYCRGHALFERIVYLNCFVYLCFVHFEIQISKINLCLFSIIYLENETD